MTRPGDQFEYSDDTVAARLSVDVPQDAVNNLHEVLDQTRELRANMEAVARSQGDYLEYLRQLPDLMRETAEANERLMSGAATATAGLAGAAAIGAANVGAAGDGPRFAGGNEADSRSTLWPQGTPGTGDDRDSTAEERLAQLRESNPRQYANLLAQQRIEEEGRRVWPEDEDGNAAPTVTPPRRNREPTPARPENRGGGSSRGGGNRDTAGPPNRPGSNPDQDDENWLRVARDLQGQGRGLLNTVLQETAQGGASNPIAQAARLAGGVGGVATSVLAAERAQREQADRDFQALLARQQAGEEVDPQELARLGSLASRTGVLGSGTLNTVARGAGVVGLAAGAYAMTQDVGQWYQRHANQGAVRGGGFREGIAFEAQVRTMAINPFLSMEQSRKIMQSALNEGYTGREMETVTEFMTENLRRMNVDVAQSVQVMQQNVVKGGQNLASAQWDLRTAQQLAANPDAVRTSQEFMQSWQNTTAAAINQGVGGQQASQYALQMTSLFADNRQLEGFGDRLANAMMTNPVTQQRLANQYGYTGVLSGTLDYVSEQPGGIEGARDRSLADLQVLIRRYLPMYDNPQSRRQGLDMIAAEAAAIGIPVTIPELQGPDGLIEQARTGALATEGRAADKRAREAATGGDVRERSVMDQTGDFFMSIGEGLSAGAQGLWGGIQALWGGGEETRASAGRAAERSLRHGQLASPFSAGGEYTNDRINDLILDYGAQNIRVKTESGDVVGLDQGNRDLMQGIVEGKNQISVNGGGFSTFEDFSTQEQADAAAEASAGGTFDLTERAAQLLTLIPNDNRNQTQRSNDSGEDGAQRNDPPAGQGYGG